MGAVDLRNSLIARFNEIIKDDSKLMLLDGVLDSMNATDSESLVSEAHYKIVEERRRARLSGESNTKSWATIENKIKKKYGF
jgi:hypothetical protein